MGTLRRLTAFLVRSMQADVRRWIGHFARGFTAAGMLATISLVLLNASTLGSPGLKVFTWLTWCDALVITASTVIIFAPVIGAEREAGTLSLLRMTGTSPLTLVVGHSLSGILIGCLLIAVQLPFTVLTITLGGVLWNQVLAGFLALLAHLILCGGIGICLSVLCKRGGTAALYTFLVVLALWVGPLLVRRGTAGLFDSQRMSQATRQSIDQATALVDNRLIWGRLDEISSGSTSLVESQFYWSIGAGLFLMALAAAALDWRPLEVSPYSPIVVRLWRSRGQRAWKWFPIAGKDYRQFMGGFKGAIVRCVVYSVVPVALLLAMQRYGDTRMTNENLLEGAFWIAFVFLVVEIWAIAARWVRNEVVEQTWSTLTLTPRWLGTVIAQKLQGAALGILPAIAVCVAFGMSSMEVRRYWAELFSDNWRGSDGSRVLMMLPVISSAVCAASSLLMLSLPATVSMFIGIIWAAVQFFVIGITVDTLRLYQIHQKLPVLIFAGVSVLTCGISMIICLIRIRQLTARD